MPCLQSCTGCTPSPIEHAPPTAVQATGSRQVRGGGEHAAGPKTIDDAGMNRTHRHRMNRIHQNDIITPCTRKNDRTALRHAMRAAQGNVRFRLFAACCCCCCLLPDDNDELPMYVSQATSQAPHYQVFMFSITSSISIPRTYNTMYKNKMNTIFQKMQKMQKKNR